MQRLGRLQKPYFTRRVMLVVCGSTPRGFFYHVVEYGPSWLAQALGRVRIESYQPDLAQVCCTTSMKLKVLHRIAMPCSVVSCGQAVLPTFNWRHLGRKLRAYLQSFLFSTFLSFYFVSESLTTVSVSSDCGGCL